MATIYFTASSLDGYIVDEHDSLDWLTSRKIDVDGPFGYEAFMNTVGALVMGSATYEWVVKNQPGEWMYERRPGCSRTDRTSSSKGTRCRRRRGRRGSASEAGVGRGRKRRVGGRRRRGGRAVCGGRLDRRDDRHLHTVFARWRLSGAARPLGVGVGGVGRQRRLRLCPVVQDLAVGADSRQTMPPDKFP